MRTLYLNNSGSRWATFNDDGSKQKQEFTTKSGKVVTRTVRYWESCGNFAVACIKYNNKLIKVFPDTVLEDEIVKTRKFK